MFRTLGNLFRLKPYGNRLVDGMAEFWLILAAVNIASIALCDAIAWGYFGYTTSEGAVAWMAAALAGTIVFLLVGSLDAMFVMHDRTAAAPAAGRWRIRRDHLALGARIILVILTFTITAPFLTQLVFMRDIEANIKRSNEARIAGKRAEIAGAFDSRIGGLRETIASRQRDLEMEIGGTGTSGRYGKGPTAAAIEREVLGLEAEAARQESAKQQELGTFDRAVATPTLLANRYGVDLVREGPDTRASVVAELEKSASFRATQRTIKAFLLFMFLGLVCLKLFQPESVRIYYSARLQAAHARLEAGVFNHRLDPREQPEAGGMTPVRFAEWYEKDQGVRDATEHLRDQTVSAIERLKAQEDAVRILHQTLSQDIAGLHESLATASRTGDELEQQAFAMRQELDVLNAKIAEQQQELDDFKFDLGDDISLRDQQLLMGNRQKTIRQLSANRVAAASLSASLDRLTPRIEANRSYEKRIRESLEVTSEEVASVTRALQQARQKRLGDIIGTG